MLERLELRDFQAHKKLVIEFDPNITVVVGDTDVGKSAIIRALSWVMLNRPDGDSFIRHGKDAALATLEVDGQVIVRCRGKGENTYNLNSDEFKAFGKSVPERVSELLGVSEINFQCQHEAPFWFSESASEVSRRLNHVVDLGVIDDVLGSVAQQVRRNKANVEFCEERLKKAKEERDRLKPVLEADAALRAVEEEETRAVSLRTKRESLQELLQDLSGQRKRLETLRQTAQRGRELVELADASRSWQKDAEALRSLLTSLQGQRKILKVKLPDIGALNKLHDDWVMLRNQRERLATVLETQRELWKDHRRAEHARIDAKNEFDKHTKGAHCPLCGHAHE